MTNTWRCHLQRNAGVLIWVPVLLLGPLFSLPTGPARVAALAVVLVMGVAAWFALLSGTGRMPSRGYVALVVLAAAVVVGTRFGSGWLPTWVLLAITLPAVLRRSWLIVALVLTVAGAVAAAWLSGEGATAVEVQGFVVSLAGAATTSFLRLMETVDELHRTREELARSAVAEERERFSRDLHDLLGHTLSVMVVKAEAVRRLAHRDPDAVAAHAADIEQVGRGALLEVRDAVDAMRMPSLEEELDGARRALHAAGIETTVSSPTGQMPVETAAAFAWVVREGATNVLRHSGAAHCRIEIHDGAGALSLTVADDGIGSTPRRDDREGGLDGLRRRVVAAGGRLDVDPDAEGFRLTARIPVGGRP
ncbi:MAG: sensor histidine kinase [Nocardioidaceae bacterium]